MDFFDHYEEFLIYLDAKGHSPCTITTYRSDENVFRRFLKQIELSSKLGIFPSPTLYGFKGYESMQNRLNIECQITEKRNPFLLIRSSIFSRKNETEIHI